MQIRNSLSGKKPFRYTPYLFVVPALIVHMCLVAVPSLSTLVMSLYDWNGLGGAEYIGLANFVEIFTDDRVISIALTNNLKWLAIFITIPIILAFVVAIAVSRVKGPDDISHHLFYSLRHLQRRGRQNMVELF